MNFEQAAKLKWYLNGMENKLTRGVESILNDEKPMPHEPVSTEADITSEYEKDLRKRGIVGYLGGNGNEK